VLEELSEIVLIIDLKKNLSANDLSVFSASYDITLAMWLRLIVVTEDFRDAREICYRNIKES
jgi:hypothetical protein